LFSRNFFDPRPPGDGEKWLAEHENESMSSSRKPRKKLLEGRRNSQLLLRIESLSVPYWLRPHDRPSSLQLPQQHVLYARPRRRLYREYHSLPSAQRPAQRHKSSSGFGSFLKGALAITNAVLQVENQVLAAQNGAGATFNVGSLGGEEEEEEEDQWT